MTGPSTDSTSVVEGAGFYFKVRRSTVESLLVSLRAYRLATRWFTHRMKKQRWTADPTPCSAVGVSVDHYRCLRCGEQKSADNEGPSEHLAHSPILCLQYEPISTVDELRSIARSLDLEVFLHPPDLGL